MRLTQFRIQNFRSVNDSGPIKVGDRVALVGRNESGKTNLLLALQSLKPPGPLIALSETKDFPRDRRLTEFNDEVRVVDSEWALSSDEAAALAKIFPRASGITTVTVSRPYKATRYIGFPGLPALTVDDDFVTKAHKKIRSSVSGSLKGKEEAVSAKITAAVEGLISKTADTSVPATWAATVKPAVDQLRSQLAADGAAVPEEAERGLADLSTRAAAVVGDAAAIKAGREWVVNSLPVFIYLNDFPELHGHQDVTQFLQKKADGTMGEAEVNFEKLCKVAGLNPASLQDLLNQDHEKRMQLANRAGAVVTSKIRDLWTDRALKVRFNLDATHFDTLLSDPNAAYDVEVNLNERSRGFRWFFSFYITFTADTDGGAAHNAVLLLDEPGLYLHAVAQRDLLDHFAKDFKNQILFTTHSPFMIPRDISAIRTVNISNDAGTTVTNDPTGDEKTLFPLQAALGYDLTQTLFIGEMDLVVEGVTDYWYLSIASDHLNEVGRKGLPKGIVVTPVGGAQKVSYMVALLTSQKLKVVVLLDEEKEARNASEQMVKTKLIREENVLFISEAWDVRPGGADVEDLLDPAIFDGLVKETYQSELKGKSLALNPNIPRIVKRYEAAFEELGLTFNKTRPAKLFVRKAAANPKSVLDTDALIRFEKLCGVVAGRFAAQDKRPQDPFK